MLGTHVAACDRVDGVPAVIDAPLGKCLHVILVEGAKALISKGFRRSKLACAERGSGPPACLQVLRDALEAGSKRNRVAESDALDGETRLRGDPSRILEHSGDEAKAA